MGVFFELRTYKIFKGKMNKWIDLMEKEIIPFQVSKGAVITASFIVEEESQMYIWIRRFSGERERKRIYKEVYESDHWKDNIQPRVLKLMDKSEISIKKIRPTKLSIIQ